MSIPLLDFLAKQPPEYLVFYLLLFIVPIVPNLWSIWHAFNRYFPTKQEKMIWIGLCIFIPVFGGIGYLLFGLRRSQKAEPQQPEHAE